jgi:ATP-binding protein involved in chromosome partitioning
MENIKDSIENIFDQHNQIKPFLKKNITVNETEDQLDIIIKMGFTFKNLEQNYKNMITECLNNIDKKINISLELDVVSHKTQGTTQSIKNVKNIIAVASGKGGVGKSTVACNLSIALHQLGARVGILDADIYGPSQPLMFGANKKPESRDGKSMEPIISHGIQTMSIGYLIDPDTPVVWRGPMVTNTLQQLLNETNWDNLDYLIIDLPPGTGDTQLTLAQKVPVTGSVIVTTPQDVALIDAQKGIGMFDKVNIPNIGLVENMAVFECPNCGHPEHIFGEDGGKTLAAKNNILLLGSIPLNAMIQKKMDSGAPPLLDNENPSINEAFLSIAEKVSIKIAQMKENFKDKFPKIVIQKD